MFEMKQCLLPASTNSLRRPLLANAYKERGHKKRIKWRNREKIWTYIWPKKCLEREGIRKGLNEGIWKKIWPKKNLIEVSVARRVPGIYVVLSLARPVKIWHNCKNMEQMYKKVMYWMDGRKIGFLLALHQRHLVNPWPRPWPWPWPWPWVMVQTMTMTKTKTNTIFHFTHLGTGIRDSLLILG